ncbi:MAG: extracellular solute-binding protein [Anaerolineae bacterium]|nr:substrate-binding domain-containing protein [Anaerolineae bacterium]MDW8099757.1 extracellular solute-binding protein [Anaerolineae bacterium]
MKAMQACGMSRREFLRLVGASAAGLAMGSWAVACAPSTPAPAPAEKPSAAETPAPAPSKITLRLWSHSNPAFVQANENAIKKWQEAHPDVEVKYEYFPYGEFIQTIQTSMAAKTEADVIEMFGSWVQSYAKGGTLAEALEDVVSMSQARELFYAAPLDGYVWEGKLYGLPNEYNLENGGVLVNKRMFEEAQLKYPPEWKSWEELVEDAKKLVKMDGDVMTVAGFHYVTGDGLGFLYWQGVLERGGDYFAEDKIHLNFLSPQAEATVQWLVDMAVKDKVVDPFTFNPNSNWVGDAFFQGLVAIGYIGPWIVPVARINHPDFADPWDYVSCPHYGEKMSFAADSGWGKVVSPNSKSLQQAWEFSKFTTMDPVNARAWNVTTGTVPALKSVAEDPTLLNDMNWLGPSLKVLPYGRYVGNLQDRDFIWYNVIATRLVETMQGQHTVQEVLAIMHEEANAMIDSKLKG